MMSLPNRCSLHPHRPAVGICSLCLHDRLNLLIDSIRHDAASDAEYEARSIHSFRTILEEEHPRLRLPHPLPHPLLPRKKPVSDLNSYGKVPAKKVLHHHENLEDSINTALQAVKHAHQQLSFVAQSPHQGVIRRAPAASPQINGHASLPGSRRRSNASVADAKSFPGAMDTSGKRKSSWFSISKGRSSLLNSPLPQISRRHTDNNGLQSSPNVSIIAGRKSASDAISRPCTSYRQGCIAELGSISEIYLGDAAIKIERESNGDRRANSSWMSSLFHRKKGHRHKLDDQHDVGMNASAVGSNAASKMPAATLTTRSSLPSLEPGRLSWDGPKPSVNQMLKRAEARKKQQRIDCSPLHRFASGSVGSEDGMLGQGSALYKCKSVATSTRSTNVDMSYNSSRQAQLSPLLHSGKNTVRGMESCNGNSTGREPRSWGKTWNRTLSPFLGLRTFTARRPQEFGHQHEVYASVNHVNHRSSLAGAPPSGNYYTSPLSRRQYNPHAQTQPA